MKEFDSLFETIKILRSPKGCPWDKAQKCDDMKKYLLEEVYELIDALDKKQVDTIKEELGDIFLILIVISQMYKEKGDFGLKEVFEQINRKLVLRHPHVFSSTKLGTKEEVLNYWVKHKAKSKKRKSIKERLPKDAPSLLLANVFLKERAYLAKQDRKVKVDEDIREIKERFGLSVEGKDKERLLTDLIYEICKLGFAWGVDLEGSLRKSILGRAQATNY